MNCIQLREGRRTNFLISLCSALALLLALGVRQESRTQQSQPASSQRPSSEQSSQSNANDQDIVRITTNLVQVDAVVTKDGQPVIDLKPQDFEVLQDGKAQNITHFAYISNLPVSNLVPIEAETRPTNNSVRAQVVPPPNVAIAPQRHAARRTFALVIDDLGVSFESMEDLRDQMRKFLDTQLQPNDLVAIIRTGGYVGALQQFTTDHRLLYDSLARVKWSPCSRTGIGFASNMEGISCGDPADILRATLHSLDFILEGMRDLPGRKSMIVFTDNLPTRVIEDGPLTNPSAGLRHNYPGLDPGKIDYGRSVEIAKSPDLDRSTSIASRLDWIVEMAIRGSVVIYSVDTRGQQFTGARASDSVTMVSAAPTAPSVEPGFHSQGGLSMEAEQRSLEGTRSRQLITGREGARSISDRTGGFSVFNSNDFGFNRIMNDQQGYYLIGYRPVEETFNRQFHHIKLRVKPRGLKVSTREGFYGVDDKVARPQHTAIDRINAALISPFATNDITVQLTSFFANDAKTGPVLRSYLLLDPRELTFTDQPDGTHQATLDLSGILFGDNGGVVRRQDQQATLRLKGKPYERALRDGFVYSFDLPIKQSGVLQYRIAIRDKASSRIGSAGQLVEVPDLNKKRLAVSGLVVQDEATLFSQNSAKPSPDTAIDDSIIREPALRRFHQGATLNFAYEIYNTKIDQSRQPHLTAQMRLYRDGKLIYAGNANPLDISTQTDLERISANARLQLGADLPPGEYIVQIIVQDLLAKEKQRTATQWIDFEVLK